MKRLKLLLLVLAGSLMLTGCDFDVYKLPLPGGPDAGSDPMVVKVKFVDVMDLVPKSTVKVNDVSVGQVTDVSLDGWTAEVTLEMRNDIDLPDNAIAEIRQTSLLGEKFVSLSPPPTGASDNPLSSGDVIGLDRSGRNPEVEEVLGALSLLLNGGGVAQLKTIAQELNLALEGREGSARSVLNQIKILMTQLDENKTDIVDAIDSLNNLAISVRKQQGTIDAALDELPSALTSLDKQRGDLVKMLQALNRLGGVGVRVIQASKADTIETFRQLEPTLTQLARSGDDFVKAFNVFLTYPFVDEVVGRDPQVARNLHMGDYTNLSVQMNIDATGQSSAPPGPSVPSDVCIPLKDLPDTGPLPPAGKICQGALAAINKCLEHPSEQNCKGMPGAVIGSVCKDNPLPLCPAGGTPGSPTLPPLPIPLPRAGYGPTNSWDTKGPTLGELMQLYDPALVSLLIPGMVTR